MFSIVKPLSIRIPNVAVPNAVEKTINAVVKALMPPMNFTPYISAHIEDPKTLANPLDIPISPRNKYAEYSWLLNSKTNIEINKGMFKNKISFLLVNLSTKKPEKKSVVIEAME